MRQKARQSDLDISVRGRGLLSRALPLTVTLAIPVTVTLAIAALTLLLCFALGPQFPFALEFTLAFGLALAVELFLLLARPVDLALRLGQHSGIVLGMLGKILSPDSIARQLGIAVQLRVFLDDLSGRAAHLAVRSRTVEHAVYDVAATWTEIAVLVAPRP